MAPADGHGPIVAAVDGPGPIVAAADGPGPLVTGPVAGGPNLAGGGPLTAAAEGPRGPVSTIRAQPGGTNGKSTWMLPFEPSKSAKLLLYRSQSKMSRKNPSESV